jgi:uncharacterized protein (TIGR00255 family)
MLLSMTGYGRVSERFKEKTILVELRALNSKYADIRIKIPQNFRDKEPDIRKILSEHAERGKLDFTLEVKSIHGDEEYSLNTSLFRKYYQELRKLSGELDMPKGDIMQSILKLPNVVMPEEDYIDEEEWEAVIRTIGKTLEKFRQYRRAEGETIEQDMRLRVRKILNMLEEVDPHEEERVNKLRQRLYQNLEEYLGKDKIDENRFEQEILFYLEKMDITEEKVRLSQHCEYYLEELDKKYVLKGRKLNFISQEMGREINTLGAKAYSSDIQRLVVNMKDELEKIKEQIANSV